LMGSVTVVDCRCVAAAAIEALTAVAAAIKAKATTAATASRGL
jgi:hypothetical protein